MTAWSMQICAYVLTGFVFLGRILLKFGLKLVKPVLQYSHVFQHMFMLLGLFFIIIFARLQGQ